MRFHDTTIEKFAHARRYNVDGTYCCKSCKGKLLYVDFILQHTMGGNAVAIDVWECARCERAWRVWDSTPLPAPFSKGKDKKPSLNEGQGQNQTPTPTQLSIFDNEEIGV